jgi:hypothetical protein
VSIFLRKFIIELLIIVSQSKDNLIIEEIKHVIGIDRQYIGYISKHNRVTALELDMRLRSVDGDSITLPESLGDLDQLEELELIEGWSLNAIPESIGNLQKLKKLDCTGCRSLKTLPNSISSLKRLDHLDLSNCVSLKQLPTEITKFSKLTRIILRDCQSLTFLPSNLGNLKYLEILDLTNCRSLKEIPESVSNLPNLKILRTKSCNSMKILPNDIGNLQSLEELTVDSCILLSQIPESISKLALLDSLNFSYCYSLSELPNSIGSMQNLKSIDLRGCRALKTLPIEFGNLQYLETLNLYACRNVEVSPNTIRKMRSLKSLNLSHCDKLLNLSKEIKDLRNLMIVKVEKSVISESRAFDDDIGLRIYQEKVQKEIPKDEVRHYSKFTEKYINQGVIPQEAKLLAHFSILAEAELTKAELYEDIFADACSDMFSTHHFRINSEGHIIELYLHSPVNGYLSILPNMLRKLEQLEVIFFPENSIKDIPEWITDFKFLRVLEVINYEQPYAVVPESIQSYLESLEQYNKF